MLLSYLAYAIHANKVFTVFKLDAVFLQRLVEPVLFVLTLVSQCLTSHVLKRTLILAESLTSDPYKPGPLKIRLSVVATPDVGMPSRYVLLEVRVSEIAVGTLLPLGGRVFLQHVLDDCQLVVVVLAAVRTEVAVGVFRVGVVPAFPLLPLHFTPT